MTAAQVNPIEKLRICDLGWKQQTRNNVTTTTNEKVNVATNNRLEVLRHATQSAMNAVAISVARIVIGLSRITI